ncbi:hypothetical protein BDV93DRAFT_218118 [Ceratobasidium sp. AG-I]|nr:hypothetical protein BDV93DRAFT_218118 [Ceratobasidium sp. AG-I]
MTGSLLLQLRPFCDLIIWLMTGIGIGLSLVLGLRFYNKVIFSSSGILEKLVWKLI